MRAISRELPAIIITLQQLHETTGDAETFGLCTLLASFTCIASVMLLSEAMQKSEAYKRIFPNTFSLFQILQVIPVGTATVERSFSDLKMIKTRLRNRLSDSNLDKLMKIGIEGPSTISDIDFEEIVDVFSKNKRRNSIVLHVM